MALTESTRAGEFLIAEGNGTISREKVVVVSGAGALVPGTVLGKVTASGKYAPYNNAVDPVDGTETAAAILYAAVDATAADAEAVVIMRHAEVDETQLIGIDAAGKADLAALQIIVR